MAARPGEELVATLFADLHYYYGSPTAKPPHHRFDKGSYVYLFENASQRRARIEVANNAGTPEQDAFNGHLDGAHVQYSYKHSILITLTVDGPSQAYAHAPTDSQEWHLPTFDPKNDRKYMYKLHTVDIYFWTKEDALQFLNGVRRVLPQQQVAVLDEPVAPPPHQNEMSPVVQQLENVAITDPSYQQGRTRDSRTAAAPSFPGPPGPPISATPQSQEASNFAPMAYNPAAPAAPEVIQHRVKTPPPEDGAGNPLVAAATSDQGQTYGVPFQNPGGFSGPPQAAPQQSYFPGPPPPSAGLQSPYSQPPPSASLQSQFGQPLPSAGLQSQFSQPPPSAGLQSPYAHSFAPPPSAPKPTPPYSHSPASSIPSPPASLPPPPAPPAYQAHPASPPVTQYANYPGSPGIPPGMSTPGLYSPGQPYTPGAPPPPGGFAQYNYNPSLSHTVPLGGDYSIHQQVYRPTEGEVTAKTKPSKPPRGKLEERAGQLEKGVGGFLKKLEKKIG
ncbi:hypothetical protein LARI1_G008139 [Lachnellula arida]|uniref:RNA recognition motif-containing protein n=1 Tax=Lachnellula arida TaxID=1316785 RepID=A0A8T9B2Q8_9HELO|nr:hypothetical protein LARI1_G008139 [Lachnellula arida]